MDFTLLFCVNNNRFKHVTQMQKNGTVGLLKWKFCDTFCD